MLCGAHDSDVVYLSGRYSVVSTQSWLGTFSCLVMHVASDVSRQSCPTGGQFLFLRAWGNLPPAPSAHRPGPLTGLQSSEAGGLNDGESGVWNIPYVDLGFKCELGQVALSHLTYKWEEHCSSLGRLGGRTDPLCATGRQHGPCGHRHGWGRDRPCRL